MSISRGSVPTLVDRGRQKKKSSAGDIETFTVCHVLLQRMQSVLNAKKAKVAYAILNQYIILTGQSHPAGQYHQRINYDTSINRFDR